MKTKKSKRAGGPVPAPAFGPGTILVPVDFSTPGAKALRYAAALARRYGSALRLLHVIEPPPYPEFGYVHLARKEVQLRQHAGARLKDLLQQPALHGLPRITTAVRYGRASQEIVAEAAECQAQLIVQATHGHSGLAHVLLGSTAEKVVRTSRCPVLVVRTHERDFLR